VLACARPGPSYGRMLYDARRDVAATLMDTLEGSPEAAAALPGDMAAAGCRHTLTADVLKQAALFYVVKAALEAVTACQEEGRAVPRDVAAGARQAVDELLALRPRWPRYLALGSEVALAVGDGAAAVAGWHAAREAAEAQRGGLLRAGRGVALCRRSRCRLQRSFLPDRWQARSALRPPARQTNSGAWCPLPSSTCPPPPPPKKKITIKKHAVSLLLGGSGLLGPGQRAADGRRGRGAVRAAPGAGAAG
jgi:hypothetical protein